MIVKIWPIKGDYARNKGMPGGTKGLQNAFNYITNEEKVISQRDDIQLIERFDIESLYAGREKEFYEIKVGDDVRRVIDYMSNEQKIKSKYISGYLCSPGMAIEEFEFTRANLEKKSKIIIEKESGALAYHIVQSFPEGLDISDEEVHQCGIELCKKIGHQAVICSHVHPEFDEESGEIKGKCKHNHILINAYIPPQSWSEEHPERLKYHDCKETYARLQAWNDEIAIEHGLPIIREPDEERMYSWSESEERNKGFSWKERMREDIENIRRATNSWDSFKKEMERNGYKVKDNVKHLSYTAPDGKTVARAKTLGRRYTRRSIELFWSIRANGYQAVEMAAKINASTPLPELIMQSPEPLSVAIPIGLHKHGNRAYYYLPLENVKHGQEVLNTYFSSNKLYDICNSKGYPIESASADEILDCIERLKNGRSEEELLRDEEERRRKKEEEEKEKKEKQVYFTHPTFVNSRTKKPYRSPLYTKRGRRRTNIELLFILAATVLKSEGDLWEDTKNIPSGDEHHPIYAPINRKLQDMFDAMYEAQEANIETLAQLKRRQKEVGATYKRNSNALNNTKAAKEKMETLAEAVKDYRASKDLAEKIIEMEPGPEREKLEEDYEDLLMKYKQAKAVMYRYKVGNEEEIKDFEARYEKITKDITELEEKFEAAKEEYKQIMKLKYNADLAQNAQYCYGPKYIYVYSNEHGEDIKFGDNEKATRTIDEIIQEQEHAPGQWAVKPGLEREQSGGK